MVATCLCVDALNFNDFGSFGVDQDYRMTILVCGTSKIMENQYPYHFGFNTSSDFFHIEVTLKNHVIVATEIKISKLMAEKEVYWQVRLNDPFHKQKGLEGMIIISAQACLQHKQRCNPLKSQSDSFIPSTHYKEKPKTPQLSKLPNHVIPDNLSRFSFEKIANEVKNNPRAHLFNDNLQNTYIVLNLSLNITTEMLFASSDCLRDVKLYMDERKSRVTALLEFTGEGLGQDCIEVMKQVSLPGFQVRPSKFTFRAALQAEIRLERELSYEKSATIWDLKNQLAATPGLSDSQVDVLEIVRSLQAIATEVKSRKQSAIYRKMELLEYWRQEAVRYMEEKRNEELIHEMLEQERKQRQQELDNKLYSCAICYEEYLINEIYVLDGCNHKYCTHCLRHYIVTKINDGNVLKLLCPETECKIELHLNEVKHLVPKDIFDKFEKFLIQSTLEKMGDVHWCPKAGCGAPIVVGPGALMIVCPDENCRFSYCTRCKEEWHADVTCAEYQQWKVENNEAEARYQQWVKKNARKCPKCPTYIEKNGGCNHMTCKSCSHEFCWLCMKKYKSGHFSNSKCKQFS